MNEETLHQLLQQQLPDAIIVARNPLGDGMHFHTLIIDDSFEGVSLVERHRQITTPLRQAFKDDTIHALSIKVYTRTEAQKREVVLQKFGLDPTKL